MRRRFDVRRSVSLALGIALLAFAPVGTDSSVSAVEPIRLQFNDKPPFFFFEGGVPSGFLVERAKSLFAEAEVPVVMESVGFSRILANLKNGVPNVAALGFSKTEERGAYATFSLPIYKDKRPVIIVRATDRSAFLAFDTLQAMIDGAGFTFGGVSGNVYPIDGHLSRMGARDTRHEVPTFNLVRMLDARRFDFMLAYPEEVDYLLERSGVDPAKLTVVSYPDIPDGGYRYILFSKDIDHSFIERIDAVIRKRVKL